VRGMGWTRRHYMRDDCATSLAEGCKWHSALRENPSTQYKTKQRSSETAIYVSEPCQLAETPNRIVHLWHS
jgi:hypothetical protein